MLYIFFIIEGTFLQYVKISTFVLWVIYHRLYCSEILIKIHRLDSTEPLKTLIVPVTHSANLSLCFTNMFSIN